jgi:pimeloyl-ACP methyl ester carboxylesterase
MRSFLKTITAAALCCYSFILSGQNIKTIQRDSDMFISIGRSKIFYHASGKGSTPVVFVSGLGEDHHTWQTVQDSISKFEYTISYDRAGLGKSEYHGEKKDIVSLAHELHTLVNTVKVHKPFILVGHSLGCQVVKEYTFLYPHDIKGIIFLDPGYNEEKLKASVPDSVWQQRDQALKKYLPEFTIAQKAELTKANECAAISDGITTLPKIPIVLFTATHVNPDFPASSMEFKVKEQTHLLWLRSMPGAQHIYVPESRHYIHADAPQKVIDAVLKMILAGQ